MTLKPFGNTSQAKTIKISSPNPTLAKRLGWGMRFGFIQTCHQGGVGLIQHPNRQQAGGRQRHVGEIASLGEPLAHGVAGRMAEQGMLIQKAPSVIRIASRERKRLTGAMASHLPRRQPDRSGRPFHQAPIDHIWQ